MAKEAYLRRTSDGGDPYRRGQYPAHDENLDSFIRNWPRYSQRLIIFLGAGASVGAVNKLGRRLPQAYDLRNEIYSEFLLPRSQREGFDFSNLTLLSLEHVAALAEASCDRHSLQDFVAERFLVNQPLWQHAVLPFLNPLAIFTTNYDNLIELGWHLQESRYEIKPLVSLFKEASAVNKEFVPLYKSHGTVEYPRRKAGEGGFVITQFDYFDMIPHRQEMLEQFAKDFDDYCLLFVGYSFLDVDIASRLYEIRKQRGGRKWYAVFPRDNPDVREMYREKYRISQINRTFHDFLLDLDKVVDFIPEEWKFDRISDLADQGLIYGGQRAGKSKARRRAGAKKAAKKRAR
ncbi:MAG: SIR2 family protein [Acidobacteriota bacterium]|nr:SIR2 family protein [Acidobacteriota bacterium]